MLIKVGNFTRKFGSPITYDIGTTQGSQRFLSRVQLDCGDVQLKEYVEAIKAAPVFVQNRYAVAQTLKALEYEIQLREKAKQK